ncbi:flagellar hook-length control protein FliK [Arsukibacterium sp. MJ3]|uniref:flagellar hook-length control protein FliK n=1 Tax=Arsukibacterium sp. MJ3 TaxID=1632859 RepID=UPI00069C48B6|nr:flagellar hook-length control protein FliK [Arsukibacterium sp. MJ3]
MSQINLDKLLQTPPSRAGNNAGASAPELKLLVGELYNARLQMLPGSSQLQLNTPQGALTLNLPTPQGQQINQQFGQQLQVKLSPAANNQLSLLLQTPPATVSRISLNQAQLPAILSQWLSQQLPQLSSALTNPALLNGQAETPTQQQAAAQQPLKTSNNVLNQTNAVTLPIILNTKSGQLQLANTAGNNLLLLTLTGKELATIQQLTQQAVNLSAQPSKTAQSAEGKIAMLLKLEFNKPNQRLQLQVQLPMPATTQPLVLTATSQQQLLQALLNLLPPIRATAAVTGGTAPTTITLGGLNIAIPATLLANVVNNAANANTPLLLQLQPPTTKNNQWQLLMQPVPQTQQITLEQSQANRLLQWQSTTTGSGGLPLPGQTITNSAVLQNQQPGFTTLAPETKAQAWRNLLPLLAQPLMQSNNLPNLPAPLQQLLSQIQQSLPEVSKPLAAPALAAQLNALLQFQPLQSQPNLQTSGGTLALAIQLLLGHLSQKQLSPAQNASGNRLSQLVSQLDQSQAGTALRQLASLSSPIQQSQLATLDAQSQVQQWLLQLPLQQQGQTILPQLLLEQREADAKSGDTGKKQWQLTMKFDLQQYGKLLVVAKLQEQDLQLQFYTDHNQALRLAQKFLPLLKDRCLAQGLTVSKADCQLGKIPDSLLPRHNSLLTVKV